MTLRRRVAASRWVLHRDREIGWYVQEISADWPGYDSEIDAVTEARERNAAEVEAAASDLMVARDKLTRKRAWIRDGVQVRRRSDVWNTSPSARR